MRDLPLTPHADAFIWASGIENTFIPQERPGLRAMDEYELMGHYDHWREDLALARELGLQAMRWGIPWYRVEPQRGHFDWSWTDQVIPYMVEELGITPLIDLMHYGCPFWLKREFASPAYPEAVASYAAAFAERYQNLVRWYTPLNEPLVNALFCGRRGLWPPYLRGDRGYVSVMMQLARGIFNTVNAIRAVQPDALMLHVEATGLQRAADSSLEPLARAEQAQTFLCYDLLTGRVTPDHPLFTWLVRNGASVRDLQQFTRHPLTLDMLGLNFYPQWSTNQVYLNRNGRLAYRATEQAGENFAELLETYYQRYQVPIMVTETSAKGHDDGRERWLDSSLAVIKGLRERGIPIMGYTWFPLFTMIDWRYRYSNAPMEHFYLELGLYRLNRGGEGRRWQASPLVERFCDYVRNPQAAIGNLAVATPAPEPVAAVERPFAPAYAFAPAAF